MDVARGGDSGDVPGDELAASRCAVEWPECAKPWPYLLLWGGGLALWAPIFWKLRHRIGPVTAVERQIAHIWGGSIAAVVLLFVVESLLGLPVLTLSPVLGLIGGAVFVAKAGILSGVFYLQAVAMFATALVMAELQRRGIDYGVVALRPGLRGGVFLAGLEVLPAEPRGSDDASRARRRQTTCRAAASCRDSSGRSIRTRFDGRSDTCVSEPAGF